MRKRLAIIGAGSSGLICLKNAIDQLPDWDIVCLEKSDSIRGCWGNPYPGFVSTSTKYTTQFACFAKYDASVAPDGGASRSEFFCEGEYGDYLEAFADEFDLRDRIDLQCEVLHLSREDSASPWQLKWQSCTGIHSETFDAVVLATGLAANAKPIRCEIPTLYPSDLRSDDFAPNIRDKRVVVMGGGESAVDIARRLAESSRNNEVFLSLRSGIRVSPRYHPIRGVPSDFLRNRLMLSIHPDLRNWIGQRFVAARIQHQRVFEKLFPSDSVKSTEDENRLLAGKRDWALRFTNHAKGNLFDMFHNKSDDFLEVVARGDITPVGVPADDSYNRYLPFGSSATLSGAGEMRESGDDAGPSIAVNPDWIVPAIGYHSVIDQLTDGTISAKDFYLGCIHAEHADLFLVGFARPVIGNIPTISEMQARYICGTLAGKWPRPDSVRSKHQNDIRELEMRFSSLNLDAVYPVEMFPYCDQLATQMHAYPNIRVAGGLAKWWRMQLSPATTLHYASDQKRINQQAMENPAVQAPIYLPAILTVLLLFLKPFDAVYRMCRMAIGARVSRTYQSRPQDTSRELGP